MATTLTVLGGSAASAGTGQGCSGYLVSTAGTNILLDPGPGTLLELRKHTDFRSLNAVVLSHLHVDHMLDVVAMRFALAYNPVKPGARVPLWLPPGGLVFMERLGAVFSPEEAPGAFFGAVFDVAEYDPDGQVQIGDFAVSFHPTVHFVPCWAIRIRQLGSDGDLMYTADTGPSADLHSFAKGARIVLAEAATPGAQRDAMPFDARGHLTATEAAQLASDAGAAILVLTHIFEENDPARSLQEAGAVFDGEILLARPGGGLSWS